MNHVCSNIVPQAQIPYQPLAWHQDVFQDIQNRLGGDSEFPCVFSKNAFRKQSLRFIFVENIEPSGIRHLGDGLHDYVEMSKKWDGSLDTAYPLVVAFSTDSVSAKSVEEYHALGWEILQKLHEVDPAPWPVHVSTDPNSAAWSMCFDGMPLFCNMSSPAHRFRKSRNLGRHFILVINPRERFDIFAGDTPGGRSVRANIRNRIGRYDGMPHALQLGNYGTGGCEWWQYGLVEENVERIDQCPFLAHKSLGEPNACLGSMLRLPAPQLHSKKGSLKMVELIVSQGRIADRAARMIEGAARTAQALQDRYGFRSRTVGTPEPHANDDWSVSLPRAKDTLTELRFAVESSIKTGPLTVMLANTCSASLATLPVVAREHPDAVVLWIDAHGDFNTPETTDSGYLGGMVLSGACGLWDSGHGAGLEPRQVILVGARDIGVAERELLQYAGVRIIPPDQVTPENVLSAIAGAPVWVHIDWDVLEPGYLPADYSVPNGLVPKQIKAIFESIPVSSIRGIELAEFNASMDADSNDRAVSIILDIVAPVFEALKSE